VRGRNFPNSNRSSTPHNLINDALARKFFPNEDSIRKHLDVTMFPTSHEVIGVVNGLAAAFALTLLLFLSVVWRGSGRREHVHNDLVTAGDRLSTRLLSSGSPRNAHRSIASFALRVARKAIDRSTEQKESCVICGCDTLFAR
jgi:hypothetical protein